jgi:predicted aldo/keto reductase-like oxidoreductase
MSNKKFSAECIKCGKCEEECTQHLPIIDRLKQIAEWEEKGTNDVTV